MKYFLLFIIYLNPLFASDQEKCFKENHGESCYKYGFEIFMTISSAKNEKDSKLIKDKAVKAFAHGCNNNNQQSCFQLGQYHLQIGDKLIGKSILDRSCKKNYKPSCEALKKI